MMVLPTEMRSVLTLSGAGAGTYNVAFVVREVFYNQNFYKKCGVKVGFALDVGDVSPKKRSRRCGVFPFPRKPADETRGWRTLRRK